MKYIHLDKNYGKIQFQIPLEEIQKKTIVLQVNEWDRFTKDDKMGEVKLSLSKYKYVLDLLRSTFHWTRWTSQK